MEILLDTHILLWLLYDDDKLPKEALDIIVNQNNEIFYSTVSLLEISIKHEKYPKDFPFTSRDVFETALDSNISGLALFDKHIFQLDSLITKGEIKHKDPFDKLLLAQAKRSKMKFITHDRAFNNYNEDFIILV